MAGLPPEPLFVLHEPLTVLREPLTGDQLRLLRVIFEPFGDEGLWPLWQYVDLTMAGKFGLDAAALLDSLPVAGVRGPMSRAYGLTWRDDAHMAPQERTQVCLTVPGLLHLDEAAPLLGGFLTMLTQMISRQQELTPDPQNIVEAEFSSREIPDLLHRAILAGADALADELAFGSPEMTARKLRLLFEHEPWTYIFRRPQPDVEEWTLRVPAILRAYRDVGSVDEYVDRTIELWVPQEAPSAPLSADPLDIPTALGYLGAVWQNATGSPLFVNLDPVSVAKLTQACGTAEEFDSLMSALADVLAQVAVPGTAEPPRGGALEKVRDWLVPRLDPAAAASRVQDAFETLIRLRRIRVGSQHSDARGRAVRAFGEIGLAYPPRAWYDAWTHIAVLAKGALDIIREEVHVGLRQS
jgi:hypothetical protein